MVIAKTQKPESSYDVAIIGGGPAGMMAAINASNLGASVLLVEKNDSLGKKLLITGKGRCNLTNAEFNHREFVKQFGKNGDFLLSGFSIFGSKETIDFFEKLGVRTKIERGKRVFPESDRAQDILSALSSALKKNQVQIITGKKVKDIVLEKKNIKYLLLEDDTKIFAKNFILTTGGLTYPLLGSTGDGYGFSEKLGHKIIAPKPALVPIAIEETWPKHLQGLTLKNINLTVFQDSKKVDSRFGEMLFTHFGISGPIVLDLSKKIGAYLEKGVVTLILDLKPALDFAKLDKRIQRDFEKYKNKQFKNALSDLLPQKLIETIIYFSGIDLNKTISNITREERHKLVKMLKNLRMTPVKLLDFDEAIITTGGIDLKEIDSKTMRSKLIGNLFFAGEIIDLDGPTGGFNLQLCWTTGFVAGKNAATNYKL